LLRKAALAHTAELLRWEHATFLVKVERSLLTDENIYGAAVQTLRNDGHDEVGAVEGKLTAY